MAGVVGNDGKGQASATPDPHEHPRAGTWLVIPLFDEAGIVGDIVADVRRRFPHVVCVDDGSTDGSGDVARRAGAIVVTHGANLGQGAALQTGFEYVLRVPWMSHVVTFDADGQHQVADAERMLDRLDRDGLDAVLGSRFLNRTTQASVLKRLVLRAGVAYTNATTGMRLTDTHNGLRVLSRGVVSRLRLTQNRMAHASELVAQLGEMSLDGRPVRYAEHPVDVLYTQYSTSKGQSVWNSVNILSDLILK